MFFMLLQEEIFIKGKHVVIDGKCLIFQYIIYGYVIDDRVKMRRIKYKNVFQINLY